MAPTPSLPLENLMPWAPPRTVVGRPLGLPGPRRRAATRIHGRRRATSRRVLRNRETAHEEDPRRTRVDSPGTGSPPDRTEGPGLSSGGPRRLCERREDLLVQRPDGRTPARGGP